VEDLQKPKSPKMTEVRVSEASRKDARGMSDAGQLQRDLDEMKRSRQAMSVENDALIREGIEIAARLKNTLPRGDYEKLTERHSKVKIRIHELQTQMSALRKEIAAMELVVRETQPCSADASILSRIFDKLESIAYELRDIKTKLRR
jgi:phage shock protein A